MDPERQNDHIFWEYLAELFLAVEERRTAAPAPPGYFPWAIRNGQPRNFYEARREIRQERTHPYSGSRNFENGREFLGTPPELGTDRYQARLQLQNSQTTMVAVNSLSDAVQALVRAPRGRFTNKAWISNRPRGSRGLGRGRGGRNHRISYGGNNGNNLNYQDHQPPQPSVPPPPLPPAASTTNSLTPTSRMNIDEIERALETPQQSHRVMSALSDLTIHPNSSTTDIPARATTPGIEMDAEGEIDSSIIQITSNGSLFDISGGNPNA
ncbi:hypothetical protein M422DRAFT_263985 [Sphaerobolus stellatus SS14]|uniref:Unplaced genomic scaffold SPHSTscaffold_130, whole genome shotgun sequence n=1 Tax=Sphaerobolus stellatus (strain SS14) TaxID=990650 RepID=A0A0C9UXL4_SPHS4|nr:hypothetical protein M422DRAFT_263985 [Sphaerobolus stellatus SS14]